MSATTDLTTLALYKQYQGLTDTNSDTPLTALITSASISLAKAYRALFIQQAVTETRDGMGKTRMLLKNYPVVSVSGVTIDGQTIPVRPSNNPLAAGYVAPDPGDNHGLLYLVGYTFNPGYQNVVVNYTAGWFANTAAAAAADVGVAANIYVKFLWDRRARPDLVTQSLGGVTTHAFLQKECPYEMTSILNNYYNPVDPADY